MIAARFVGVVRSTVFSELHRVFTVFSENKKSIFCVNN